MAFDRGSCVPGRSRCSPATPVAGTATATLSPSWSCRPDRSPRRSSIRQPCRSGRDRRSGRRVNDAGGRRRGSPRGRREARARARTPDRERACDRVRRRHASAYTLTHSCRWRRWNAHPRDRRVDDADGRHGGSPCVHRARSPCGRTPIHGRASVLRACGNPASRPFWMEAHPTVRPSRRRFQARQNGPGSADKLSTAS